ncbi:glycerol-3-phosphate dehydrogenase/oxidase [candidate division KSB1 bacterium]|nr:glycerol-3-phosphate dehydrogenase/oxidase [candidate division KSB1 bacterium]
MKRDLAQLRGKQFDVLIIGGGIYGVCAAWDAALRGLSVALIEKNDFGSATSSNSLKIIHGGLRYLQQADFKRMRESIAERTILMRIAPHLVHPLPCIIPTYGHALKGREVMAAALFINDLVGFDRNRLTDPQKRLPNGKVISKEKCKEIIPGINEENLSGGAIWYDCQVYNSERMLISILRSAVNSGAVTANYTEMVGFITEQGRVTGVKAKDNLTGDILEISAKLVINNGGPWLNDVLAHLNGKLTRPKIKLSAAMNLVIKRKLFEKYAVGIWSKSDFRDGDALLSKGSRLFFITPWREYSLIGTTHVHYDGEPGQFKIKESDIQTFLDEVNAAYPPADLRREDVAFFYGGMLPADEDQKAGEDVRLLKNYQIIDHAKDSGVEGLISVVGVKFTTARDVAVKTVDCAIEKLGKSPVKSLTCTTLIFGGDIGNFENFMDAEKSKAPHGLSENSIEHLVLNYGSEYPEILKYGEENQAFIRPISPDSEILQAEVIYAVREEMAIKLADVVRRRTELGTAGCPEDAVLRVCADLVGHELGWDEQKRQAEIEETKQIYDPAP